MKIVCASSVLNGYETFRELGETVLLREEEITADDLRDADALITRSKARINRKLLDGTAVRFVGCAVAGTDHIDPAYLEEAGIAWCHAPGCNANSVAEYIVTALLIEAERHGLELDRLTLGIVGVGHIGTRVAKKAMDLGLTTLLNDPPRAAAEGRQAGPFVDLEDLLPAVDILTFHVPYTRSGPYATEHLINHRLLAELNPGSLLINAARGEIMDSNAVAMALDRGTLRQAVLDVWEHEPTIRKDMLDRVDIATPHIAGYSLEGRLNGTRMVYEELRRFLELETRATNGEDDDGDVPERAIDAAGLSDQEVLARITQTAYPLLEDDRRFRAGASEDRTAMGRHFVECRRNYPERREFAATRFLLRHASERAYNAAWQLGFQLSD